MKLPAVHCVIDLETFATTRRATVFEIGIAFGHMDGYYFNLPTKIQGREVSVDTLTWWHEQKNNHQFLESLREYQRPQSSPYEQRILKHLLEQLNRLIFDAKNFAKLMDIPFYFWGNSPVFDQAILRSLMEEQMIVPAWSYSDEMDIRTLRKIFGGKYESKNPHNGLADAVAELEYVKSVWPSAFPQS